MHFLYFLLFYPNSEQNKFSITVNELVSDI